MEYSIDQKWLGLAKEGTRGTATPTVTRYIPVGVDSELDYKLNLIEDAQARGVLANFSPYAGTKEGTGKLSAMDVTSRIIGELLYSCLGTVTVTNNGADGSYTHTFKKDPNIYQMPSYTFTMNRGIGVKQYNLGVVKSIAFNQAVDGKLMADIDILFQTESTPTVSFTPSWDTPVPLEFYQNSFKLNNSAVTNVKDWQMTIDNGSIGQRTLNGSQDIRDVITFAKILVSGSFNVYFEDEVERNKFLANTTASLEAIITGAVIAGAHYHTLDILLPNIHYTAFPYGNLDGLLGAAVAYNAYYDTSTSKAIQVALTNDVVSYA